ncbi:TetR/AcrR family transcriptional regulator [Rhodospirillum centenum]|uniref:Transcriptional regulator, TetR family protein n=1 Tax=Rhodospirillum centenum (strain ATCC 51521 / SW) TaxID=414684 RepID=B6IYL3_RHOCS|nr:TetR/AcrR family transcriptional regulator [Rhodospirillum centenum]ACJ01387.1 transcriptional regulator, TetR family protein [Rhodospirillum centenum SW]
MTQSTHEARRRHRREAILEIARTSFFEHGYAGTSMSSIAASLGGSKTTLWSCFPSKEDLFAAVLEGETGRFRMGVLEALDQDGPLVDSLRRFCRAFLRKLLSPDILRLNRLVISEVERFPEVGRIFFEHGPKETGQRLSEYLHSAMERGQLRKADPLLAAQQLTSLCQARSHMRCLWNVGTPPRAEEIDADVETALDTFLRAYLICPETAALETAAPETA